MHPVEQALISFFEKIARQEKAELDKLRQEQCFQVRQDRWCFTLPDLHAFLQGQDDTFRGIDYRQFRQAIFSSPVNKTIKPLGAEVVVDDNRAKVDRSRYALVWHRKG